jgi:hypothetical protein
MTKDPREMTNDEIPKYPKKPEIRMTKAGSAGVGWDIGWRAKGKRKKTFNIQLLTLNVQIQNVAPSSDGIFRISSFGFLWVFGYFVIRH